MVDITLLQIPMGGYFRIRGVQGGSALAAKLRQYGLFIGDEGRLVRLAPFAGPLLLEVGGREIALGHGIAGRILVEVP